MFRVLEVDRTGHVQVSQGADRVAPPPEGVVRWIDLEAQDMPQLELLERVFRLHPLEIEDCAHFDQRPKIEEYSDHIFVVTHCFELTERSGPELQSYELHSFLGGRFLITVHAEPIAPLNAVWDRLAVDGSPARHGSDFICYLVADSLVDALFPLLDHVAQEVEQIEEAVLGYTSSHDTLGDIMRLKRLLVTLRSVLSPQRDLLARLAKCGEGLVTERTALYFRDVYDHSLRITEAIEATRDLLGNALDAYLWAASQRTNEIMKRLTLLSAIFMPLGFITGFFGQNFERMPFGSGAVFGLMLLSCAAVPACMLYFFLRSKWF